MGGTHAIPPKLRYTREAEEAVKRIMVALVAAATSGSTPISSIRGPCNPPHNTLESSTRDFELFLRTD